MLEATFEHNHNNSLAVVPGSILNAVTPFFALVRYGYSKLFAETSFSHIFPAPTIFRDRNREKDAWGQLQEITQILPCKFTNIKTLLLSDYPLKSTLKKIFHNIPTVT